jgi:hypothetical protein
VKAIVQTELGTFAVDLETEEIEPAELEDVPVSEPLHLSLPRVIASAATGSTVVAVVDRRPPLVVSHDAGTTWRETGAGLPPGAAIAVSQDDPDLIVYASRNRLHVSTDGGVFWHALSVELPKVEALTLESS